MWVLGHLGVGSKIAAPFRRELPLRWVLLGTLLPDLVDKPLYYAFSEATGRHGLEIGLVSCTRTFGHTLLALFVLSGIARAKKSKSFSALAIGVASHLVLDAFQDFWLLTVMGQPGESSLRLAALFPFFEPRFGDMPTDSLLDHLKTGARPFTIVSEGIGAILLWSTWRRRNESI